MSDKDWTDLGNDIRDMVDDAVKSQDFRKLNENICRTVTDGLDNISRSIKKNLGYGDPHGPYQNNNGQWGPHYTNRDNGSITVRPRMLRARRCRMLFHRQGTA